MKKLFIYILACSAFFALTVFSARADDASEGRLKAEVACSLCHGLNGLSTLPNAPNLAGQQAIYVSEQLRNYRSGKRQNEVMNMIAKQLTDAEIVHIAAWFSSIKIHVEAP